ncbi:MAG: MFS transporter [Acidimicrobiia bacterium]|nr:MFS transporter [Acidimicrobiia bacterium]
MSLTRVLLLAILVVTAATQSVFLVGAAFFTIGPEFGTSAAGLGVATAAFFLAASASSVAVGGWVQRVGWRTAIRVNALVSGTMTLLIAAFATSTLVLIGLMIISAAAYGLANPAANQAIAEWVPPGRRATVTGLKHAGIPLSTLLAGAAVPTVVLTFGWRTAFVVAGLGALGVAALVPRGVRTPPDRVEDPNLPPPPRLEPRDLAWLSVGSSFATWSAAALGAFGVSAAIDVGMGADAAGWLQTVGSAASIGMRFAAGWLTDRWSARGFKGIVLLTGSGSLVFLAMALAVPPWFGVLMVLAYATGWGWPGLLTFTVVQANTGTAARSSSFTQAGIFLGAGLSPLVLGVVAESAGLSAIWPVAAGALVVAAAAVSVVWRRSASQRAHT